MSVSDGELQEMRKLVLFSKRISQWHEKNLNAWPLIAFNEEAGYKIVKAEIDYMIGDKGDECYVNYIIRFKSKKLPADFEKRADALGRWVRNVFWTDMGFAVKDQDGKVLFPVEKKKNERKRKSATSR